VSHRRASVKDCCDARRSGRCHSFDGLGRAGASFRQPARLLLRTWQQGESSMQINITGLHLEVTDALLAYLEEKCERLDRHFDRTFLRGSHEERRLLPDEDQ